MQVPISEFKHYFIKRNVYNLAIKHPIETIEVRKTNYDIIADNGKLFIVPQIKSREVIYEIYEKVKFINKFTKINNYYDICLTLSDGQIFNIQLCFVKHVGTDIALKAPFSIAATLIYNAQEIYEFSVFNVIKLDELPNITQVTPDLQFGILSLGELEFIFPKWREYLLPNYVYKGEVISRYLGKILSVKPLDNYKFLISNELLPNTDIYVHLYDNLITDKFQTITSILLPSIISRTAIYSTESVDYNIITIVFGLDNKDLLYLRCVVKDGVKSVRVDLHFYMAPTSELLLKKIDAPLQRDWIINCLRDRGFLSPMNFEPTMLPSNC